MTERDGLSGITLEKWKGHFGYPQRATFSHEWECNRILTLNAWWGEVKVLIVRQSANQRKLDGHILKYPSSWSVMVDTKVVKSFRYLGVVDIEGTCCDRASYLPAADAPVLYFCIFSRLIFLIICPNLCNYILLFLIQKIFYNHEDLRPPRRPFRRLWC